MNMYNVSFQCRLFLVTRLHEPCTEDYGFQCLYMMYYMQMLFLVTTNKAPNLCTTIYIYIHTIFSNSFNTKMQRCFFSLKILK